MRALERRMMRPERSEADVDLLITGVEVSLYVGEQFCSDIKALFPKLAVQVVSSNKVLGLLGQELPMPLCGHKFNDKLLLDGCIVSGGAEAGADRNVTPAPAGR